MPSYFATLATTYCLRGSKRPSQLRAEPFTRVCVASYKYQSDSRQDAKVKQLFDCSMSSSSKGLKTAKQNKTFKTVSRVSHSTQSLRQSLSQSVCDEHNRRHGALGP
eukprot:Selendium_serpulae@DN5583_c0_g1_i1.p1